MDDVEDDMDADASAGRFRVDQLELAFGAVDQDHPAPAVLRITGLCLVERGGDHLVRVVFHRGGQPLLPGLGPLAWSAAGGAAAGRGDDVVRPARSRIRVLDDGQGGHPLAAGFLPGGQPGAERTRRPLRCLPHRLPQMPRTHHDPLAVDAEHHLPTLTDSAKRLLADLDSVMKQEMWSTVTRTKTRHTLTVLVSWLGADTPLLETDIRALVDNRPRKFSGRRVTQFLETRGLLIPDAEFRRDAYQKRLDAELAALPERAFCPGEVVWFGVQVSRQFGVDSPVSRRLMRSIIATWIMASDRWGWVS
ncbi:hypothetical protein ACFZDK_54640 [Streptomyces sp. NPDC007901]|uniref:hypothetical protein n=1 Tax=Streptomyces sp. NPDC007901 TaxID=3364785 RepID=UPI0036E67A7C